MNFRHSKKVGWSFFLFFLLFFCSFDRIGSATFFGVPKTGLQNLGSEKYPYSIYVPEGYASDRSWPLVIALYVAGGKDQTFVENWAQQAERHGFILLCPGFNIFMEGNPSAHDRRIQKLVEKVRTQYEIDSNRVLITGFGDAGHYALYLGMRFSDEISAVASVGNALHGPLEKLFRFSYAEENRLPILILTGSQNSEADPAIGQEAELFKQKGYSVEVVSAGEIKSANDPSPIPFILDWFDETGKTHRQTQKKYSLGLKQKFFKWLDRAFVNS